MAFGRTSASFYRRGVPNSFNGFAQLAQANYSIVQPTYLFIANTNFFNRNMHSIINYR